MRLSKEQNPQRNVEMEKLEQEKKKGPQNQTPEGQDSQDGNKEEIIFFASKY